MTLRDIDTTVFTAPSQTGPGDRKSLLTLQRIVAGYVGRYVYLEVGSHLGGTLVPHLLDEQCRLVYSVDKRPPTQLDERGVFFDYADNSSQKMLDVLAGIVPESRLLKLVTIDKDVADIAAAEILDHADLALIDAEHTNTAVFRDFMRLRRFLRPSAIVAFHDSHLVCDGLLNIEEFLVSEDIAFRSFFLPDWVFVIAFGKFVHVAEQALERLSFERQSFIDRSRVARWKEVSANAALIEGDRIGHISGL